MGVEVFSKSLKISIFWVHLGSFDPIQSYFFINETTSLMNRVSFGTVIPCIGREVQDNVSRFGQNH